MTYIVLLTFDLKDGKSEDYKLISEKLAEVGLTQKPVGQGGNPADLPENTYVKECEKKEFADSTAAKNAFVTYTQKVFQTNGFKGKIFCVVGESWAWGFKTVS